MSSDNPVKTIWDLVQKYPGKFAYNDCVTRIFSNPDLTWEDIQEILVKIEEKDMDVDLLRTFNRNKKLTWGCVGHCVQGCKYRCCGQWSKIPTQISLNPNINIELVKNNPEYKWDIQALCQNPSITWEDIMENRETIFGEIDDETITEEYMKNINLTPELAYSPEFLDKCPEWLKNEEVISNPNFTFEHFKKHTEVGWKINMHNPNLTWEIVKSNPDYKWNYDMLSLNPNIEWQHIKEHIKTDIENDWGYNFSLNSNLNMKIIRENKELPWCWRQLCHNSAFYWEDLPELQHLFCIFDFNKVVRNFSSNPNLTLEILDNNIDLNWNFDLIFEISRKKTSVNKIGKWFKTQSNSYKIKYSIQKAYAIKSWFDCPDNPISSKLREKWFKLGILTEISG
jgi:hypothetical protein